MEVLYELLVGTRFGLIVALYPIFIAGGARLLILTYCKVSMRKNLALDTHRYPFVP